MSYAAAREAPHRGAGIEISPSSWISCVKYEAPHRGAGIEIKYDELNESSKMEAPYRGAGIEIADRRSYRPGRFRSPLQRGWY